MRIEQNRQEIIAGTVQEAIVKGNQGEKDEASKKQAGKKSIDASSLNLLQDDILQRKQQARKDAMKIIRGQFEADGEIDQDLAKRRERIAKSRESAGDALKEINSLNEEQEKLKETYGIEEDSEEQQDLELRIKLQKAMKPGSDVTLTEEEFARVQKLGPAAEYQQAALALEGSKGKWQEEMDEAQKIMSEETQIIRGIKQELLKYHGMDDAVNAADASLKAASDEIIGMLMQDAQEHVQKEIEDAVEKGEELKEEKEEQEALRQEQKAQQEESSQKFTDMPKVQDTQQEIEERLQSILERQKLLEEDLKGIQVDNSL